MKKLLLILLFLTLTGCAGLADYSIPLDNRYRIDRLSAHEIAIYGDKPVQTGDDTREDYLYVPEKVTDVWWNDQYIIAKKLELVTTENNYKEPPKNISTEDITYWIIDVKNHQILEKTDENALQNAIEKLGIREEVQFTPVEKLKE